MGTQPSSPPPKGGGAPTQFSAKFYCGQTAGCITMQLGMEVGLSPSDIVLDGDPAPLSTKREQSPQFSAHGYYGQMAAWMICHLAWRYVSAQATMCYRWGPSSPPRKGRSSPPPLFGPCLLWPRSPISATAELLLIVCSKVECKRIQSLIMSLYKTQMTSIPF